MFESATQKITTVKTKGKAHKAHKVSSGRRRGIMLRRAIRRLTKKVARWERNQANSEKTKAGKSRNGWKTDGLKKQIAAMETAAKTA